MLQPKDIINPKRLSGYDHVHNTHGGDRPKPYMAVACGGAKKLDKHGRSWRGPCRVTALEAAQDYCDHVNGNPPSASVKLNRAGHLCIRPKDTTPQVKSAKKKSKTRAKKSRQGYVYLISDGTALKVGKTTTHPTRRIGSLQTGNPRLLTLLAFLEVDDVNVVEPSLHQKFISLNLLGEWFKYDQMILDEFGYEVSDGKTD